ncbi:MAG: HAMP domain-containing protein [Algicola sp.]|nr:HAMP domain-containing protein [Algicola sp.]
MKIRSKLLTAYLLVAVSSVMVGFVGSMTTPQVKLAFDRLTTQSIPIIVAIDDIRFAGMLLVSSTSEYGFITAENAAASLDKQADDAQQEDGEEEEQQAIAAGVLLNDAIKRYQGFVLNFFPDEKILLTRLKAATQQLLLTSDKLIKLKKQGISGRQVIELKEHFEDNEKLFLKNVENSLAQVHEERKQREAQVNDAITTGNSILWGASGLAILLALIIGNAVSRAISIPIDNLKEAAKQVGEGELDTKIEVSNADEIGELALSFNKMVEDLNESQSKLANTQSQLVQSAKLASVGEMATGVAHELNQPLGIIALNADLQIDEVAQGEFGETKEVLELIVKQVERATFIIDHLRIFGRESNNLQHSPKDINELVNEAFILLGEQLRLRDIEVVLALDEQLPPVNCNHIQLEQVLTNIISNAKDAMENTSVKQLTISTRQCNDKVVIYIKDTGSGIDPQDVDKIFDPFFTTKAVGKGTGLGLSISYGIIEDHGGKLKVSSIEGKGSIFSIELVLNEEVLL